MSTILGAGEFGQCAPATADVEKGITGLEADFLTDDCQFVILELFESLFFVDVTNKTGGIDHAGAEEPAVEVVAAVVVVADLFFVFDELEPLIRFRLVALGSRSTL